MKRRRKHPKICNNRKQTEYGDLKIAQNNAKSRHLLNSLFRILFDWIKEYKNGSIPIANLEIQTVGTQHAQSIWPNSAMPL